LETAALSPGTLRLLALLAFEAAQTVPKGIHIAEALPRTASPEAIIAFAVEQDQV